MVRSIIKIAAVCIVVFVVLAWLTVNYGHRMPTFYDCKQVIADHGATVCADEPTPVPTPDG